MCPLYRGLTCREHVDAAVDIESTRDEDLTPVPFIKLCPNSWLVPPTGAAERIPEDEQFSVGKVEARVKKMQASLGARQGPKVYGQVKNALGQADQAIEDEAWNRALQALAGVAAHVKKPHVALRHLIDARLAEIEEQVGWAFEDAQEGEGPLADRKAAVRVLVEALDVRVYGAEPKPRAAMRAWLQ